jgi:hypothetical protein
MAYKAIVKTKEKPKDKIWKDVGPPPHRPEELPKPNPQKSKPKA